jgi:hypothetical protein
VDQLGSALNVPVKYLPPEPKGSLPALEELEELSRLVRQHRPKDAPTPLLKYLSKGRIVTQNTLGMFIL